MVTRKVDISKYKQGGFMKKRCFLLIWVVILLVGFAFIAAAAEKTSDRRYTLPNHGVLQMKVPASWKDEVKQQAENLPPTITLTPASGDHFKIIITPFWKASEAAPALNDYFVHRMVERAAEANQPNAVEKPLKLIFLDGLYGRGYYFSATNKAPEKGDYKFITQGMLLVDELAVTFSILTNDEKKEVESTALTMLQSAIQAQGKGD
jgi:hypothetical protein